MAIYRMNGLVDRGSTTRATPIPPSAPAPSRPDSRAAIRDAIREERHAAADPVLRVAREVLREELAAANPTPVQRMKAAVASATALATTPSERRVLALSAVRGLGVGLGPEELAALTLEAAEATGCLFSETVVALTTEDAR